MGRKYKPGIGFYRMDAGHITNKKVRFIRNDLGNDAYYIWSSIIDYAYYEYGYFLDLNNLEDMDQFAINFCDEPMEKINRVISACVHRKLFDSDIFQNYNILTSEMMQDVYVYATANRRGKGTIFYISRELFLLEEQLLPIGVHIVPLPKQKNTLPNEIDPHTYSQTKTETKTLDKERAIAAQNFLNFDFSNAGFQQKKNAGPGNFIPPDFNQALAYFMQKKINPKNPATWYEDRCRIEANKFISHYRTRGWKLSGGLLMVDWQAAIDSWLTRDEDFNHSGHTASLSAPAKNNTITREQTLNPIEREINYVYGRFLENQDMITWRTIEMGFYTLLSNRNIFQFNKEEMEAIKQLAIEEINKNGMPITEQLLETYIKKIMVIEFFKKCNSEDRETIFSI